MACIPSSVAGREVQWYPVMDPKLAKVARCRGPDLTFRGKRSSCPAVSKLLLGCPELLLACWVPWHPVKMSGLRLASVSFSVIIRCRQKAKITTPSPIWNRPQGGRDNIFVKKSIPVLHNYYIYRYIVCVGQWRSTREKSLRIPWVIQLFGGMHTSAGGGKICTFGTHFVVLQVKTMHFRRFKK